MSAYPWPATALVFSFFGADVSAVPVSVFADAFENYEHLMDVDRYKIYRKKKDATGRPNAP